jgi:hypothetical protein
MRLGVYSSLLLILAPGCAQPYLNSHIETVNTEYRQLEDYVYSLEEENARLCQEIEALKSINATGRLPSGQPAKTNPFRRSPLGTTPRTRADSTPAEEAPIIELPSPSPSTTSPGNRSTTNRPSLAPGEESTPADTPPSIEPPRLQLEVPPPKTEDLLPVPPAGRDISIPKSSDPISPRPTNKKVTHLFLNPTLTGTADFDGRPGDDGLRIVLQPRNSENEFVPEAGPLSVVLLDPDRQGEAARIARWDFDQSNSRQLLAASDNRGIKLEVPWPAAAPHAEHLKLYVRYETADGRKLTADKDIYLNAQATAIGGWTPRAQEETRDSKHEARNKFE